MKVTRQILENKTQTGGEMKRLSFSYKDDLKKVFTRNKAGKKVPLHKLSLMEFFDLVKRIPYKRDVFFKEFVIRPKYVFRYNIADCKKKAILIASYCIINKIPFRFVASSTKKNRKVHHVFPQIFICGKWKNFDATYEKYKPFQKKILTKGELL